MLTAIDSLSNRELEIAKMVVNGSANLEIAIKLKMQMAIVGAFKSSVFEKLNVNNVIELSTLSNYEQ